jgi:DNA-binding transcriptional regulator YbjK
LRENTTRQNVAAASGLGLEERLIDAERRYEDARDTADIEKRNAQDETRKRKRAEARIGELEGRVQEAQKEVEDIKEARANDAQDLLNNAKERLAILHSEVNLLVCIVWAKLNLFSCQKLSAVTHRKKARNIRRLLKIW